MIMSASNARLPNEDTCLFQPIYNEVPSTWRDFYDNGYRPGVINEYTNVAYEYDGVKKQYIWLPDSLQGIYPTLTRTSSQNGARWPDDFSNNDPLPRSENVLSMRNIYITDMRTKISDR